MSRYTQANMMNNHGFFIVNPVFNEWTHRRPGHILSSDRAAFTVKKTPAGILVHRSLLWARLYLFSPRPRILEVIIRKNAEPGRNNWTITDGNGWGRIQQYYEDRKREGIWFRTRRVPAGGYVCILPGNVRAKDEFYRGINLKHIKVKSDLVNDR